MGVATGRDGRKMAVAAAAVLAATLALAPSPTRADPMLIDARDARMRAAMADARHTLPEFFAAMDRRAGQNFQILVPVVLGDRAEHLWLRDLRVEGERITGRVVTPPRVVTHLRVGDSHSARRAEVADWSYVTGGLMKGAWTVRAMLDRLPREQANAIRARLHP